MDAKKTSERLARQLEMVRQTKIKAIRLKLAKGNYKIENKALARSLFVTR